MTTITKKPDNPTAHLTPEDVEQLGYELDAIRQDVLGDRGDRDAAYIRRVIAVQRRLELGSRAVLLGSALPPLWVLGTVGLSISKILPLDEQRPPGTRMHRPDLVEELASRRSPSEPLGREHQRERVVRGDGV